MRNARSNGKCVYLRPLVDHSNSLRFLEAIILRPRRQQDRIGLLDAL